MIGRDHMILLQHHMMLTHYEDLVHTVDREEMANQIKVSTL